MKKLLIVALLLLAPLSPTFAGVTSYGSPFFIADTPSDLPLLPCQDFSQVYVISTGETLLNNINCPTFGSPTNYIHWTQQIQADWTETNTASYAYIKNKPNKSFNNTPTHTIVTVAAAANGFQLSTTQPAAVTYSTTIATTVSLSGNSSGYVVLEIAATNSSSAGAWQEISRSTSGQSGTLVIGLTLNQSGGGTVTGIVPVGYYARLRSVNVSGAPSFVYNSGQEVLE